MAYTTALGNFTEKNKGKPGTHHTHWLPGKQYNKTQMQADQLRKGAKKKYGNFTEQANLGTYY